MAICSICSYEFKSSGNAFATQVYRRNGIIVTVTGIPATAVCPHCGNAILEWTIAQQVEELILPLFQWGDTHTLPKPVITITFPESVPLAI